MSDLGSILAHFPACGYACFIGAVSTHSNCSLTDRECVCANAITQRVAFKCVWSSCSIPDALRFENSFFARCNVTPEADYSYEPVVLSFICLAIIFLVLRFVARLRRGLTLWWDDCFLGIAMVPIIAYAYVIWECRRLGVGLPMWAVPQENISPVLMYFLATLLLYLFSRFAVRVSISLFMLRIFTRHRPVIIVTAVLNLVFSVMMVCGVILNCQPVSYFWTFWDGQHVGHCMNLWATILAGTITATILDVVHATLPVYWVFQLQFPLAKKLAAGALFLMGVPVHVFNLLKFWSVYVLLRTHDTTGKLPGVLMYAGLEMTICVILCGIPSLRLLLAPWVSALMAAREKPAASSSAAAAAAAAQHSGSGSGGSWRSSPWRRFSKPDAIVTTITIQQRIDGTVSESDVNGTAARGPSVHKKWWTGGL